MECKKCGYIMDAFDKDCQRCGFNPLRDASEIKDKGIESATTSSDKDQNIDVAIPILSSNSPLAGKTSTVNNAIPPTTNTLSTSKVQGITITVIVVLLVSVLSYNLYSQNSYTSSPEENPPSIDQPTDQSAPPVPDDTITQEESDSIDKYTNHLKKVMDMIASADERFENAHGDASEIEMAKSEMSMANDEQLTYFDVPDELKEGNDYITQGVSEKFGVYYFFDKNASSDERRDSVAKLDASTKLISKGFDLIQEQLNIISDKEHSQVKP